MMWRIVEVTQLRAHQIAFVDDNPRVRAEVEVACGVVTATPQQVDEIAPAAIRASATGGQRLRHYRVLEARAAARDVDAEQTEVEFLRSCDVRVTLLNPEGLQSRIIELAKRTNQLNYTGHDRLSAPGLAALVADDECEAVAVAATDRFGDYGVVGFAALNRRSATIPHFFFSCRVLNMGVVEFVHQVLGAPAFSVPTVRTHAVEAAEAVDWITLDPHARPRLGSSPRNGSARRVGLFGGCDLEAMIGYLRPAGVIEPLWRVGDVERGAARLGHSSLLVFDAVQRGFSHELDTVPWVSNWRTVADYRDLDAVVLSLWVDYVASTYVHRSLGFRIPRFDRDGEHAPYWWGGWTGQEDFDRTYAEAAPLRPPEVVELIVRVRSSLPQTSQLVVMNLPEVEARETSGAHGQAARFAEINRHVDAYVASADVGLVDLRPRVRSRLDLGGDGVVTHYSRRVYADLASDIGAALRPGLRGSLTRPGDLTSRR